MLLVCPLGGKVRCRLPGRGAGVLCLLVSLLVEVLPVFERTSHHQGMDIIEWVAKVPWLF